MQRFCAAFSAGCSHKNTPAEDKDSNKDASVSDEPEDTEELSEAEIYERGYDLPIDSAETGRGGAGLRGNDGGDPRHL